MKFSQHDIQKLGKRLRDGSRAPADIAFLEEFRIAHDPLLLDYSIKISEILSTAGIKYLCTGRPKRTKSIIRKLERPENVGMDLSRLGDIVGLRIIVSDLAAQDACAEALAGKLTIYRSKDHRERQDGYRAVHYVIKEGKLQLEVQIRTLVQHLWAEESESFGEQVKEGGGPKEIRDYLNQLALSCFQKENGAVPSEHIHSEVYKARNPIPGRLDILTERFDIATIMNYDQPISYVVVFDTATRELTQLFPYSNDERSRAINGFHKLTRQLSSERYDVLVLNTSNKNSITVTHSRFF